MPKNSDQALQGLGLAVWSAVPLTRPILFVLEF